MRDKKLVSRMRGATKAVEKIRRKIRRRIKTSKPGPVPRVFTPGPRTR